VYGNGGDRFPAAQRWRSSPSSKPLRMSVTPAASQIRVPDGSAITSSPPAIPSQRAARGGCSGI